jgi:hypothetical protein
MKLLIMKLCEVVWEQGSVLELVIEQPLATLSCCAIATFTSSSRSRPSSPPESTPIIVGDVFEEI